MLVIHAIVISRLPACPEQQGTYLEFLSGLLVELISTFYLSFYSLVLHIKISVFKIILGRRNRKAFIYNFILPL